ncbi:MAG TPA: hypothetical protein VNG12_16825 [Acidimicrobiales bacterium]|nr:hypothetical protein [Acidimicrobiales bacterium]
MVLESCHATWVFDREAMRCRRIIKSVEVNGHPVATQWLAYYGIELDEHSESFMVLLSPEHTKLLRSWRHTHNCSQCGGNVTAELSLDDLQAALG